MGVQCAAGLETADGVLQFAEAVEDGEHDWRVVVTRGQRDRREAEPNWAEEETPDCRFAARAG